VTSPTLHSVGRSTGFVALDFRAKAAIFVAASCLAILWDDVRFTVGLALIVLAGCRAAGISGSYLAFVLRVMSPFFVLLLGTHGFFNQQYVLRLTGQEQLTALIAVPEPWWVVGGMVLSKEGLLYGATAVGKSLTFLLLVPLCVFTTDPNQWVVGLVRLRIPFKFAFLISSTLRFFPLIFDEIQAVRETQRLRGFALETMGPLERVRTYARIAVPVILSAMHKAQQIEVVLQSRAFSGRSDRTYLHSPELGAAGWITIVLSAAAVVAAVIVELTTGLGRFVTL
jgi:energy-coupling factor transport system permease protein